MELDYRQRKTAPILPVGQLISAAYGSSPQRRPSADAYGRPAYCGRGDGLEQATPNLMDLRGNSYKFREADFTGLISRIYF